jgi:predicted phage replisome organizer
MNTFHPPEVRRDRWIRLATGMFDDEKIKLIQAMPEGARLIIIWLRLLCVAGKCDAGGAVFITREIPMNPEMLAVMFGEDLTVVQLAVQTFARFRMIEIIEGKLRIINWERHQQRDALDARREQQRIASASYRGKKKTCLALPAATITETPPTATADPWTGCTLAVVAEWRAAFDALSATGKLPALRGEHLAIVNREYPRAKLTENFGEIVAEVSGVTGTINATLPWLRKHIGALEQRLEQRASERPPNNTDKF